MLCGKVHGFLITFFFSPLFFGGTCGEHIYAVIATHRPEAVVQDSGVEQSPSLPGLVQDRQHDLVPQGGVEADDLLDVAEQLGGLHLRQQAALLQVQQPAQEQLKQTNKRYVKT